MLKPKRKSILFWLENQGQEDQTMMCSKQMKCFRFFQVKDNLKILIFLGFFKSKVFLSQGFFLVKGFFSSRKSKVFCKSKGEVLRLTKQVWWHLRHSLLAMSAKNCKKNKKCDILEQENKSCVALCITAKVYHTNWKL